MANKIKIIIALVALFIVPVTVLMFLREIPLNSLLLRIIVIGALFLGYLMFSTWILDRVEKWRQK